MIFKHIDFQVPGWGELTQPPVITSGVPGATPVALAQSALAGFTDDGPASVGLRATMAEGPGDGHIEHPLPSPPVLHTRVLFAPRSAAGGSLKFAGGWASDGGSRWWLSFNADTRTVSLTIPGRVPLDAVMPDAFAWHSVEVKIGSATGDAALFLNGLSVGLTTGGPIGVTELAWLGARDKSEALVGGYDLDDWVLANAPIGPRRVVPSRADAGDPARWLVVYNTDHADSTAWAEYYRSARSVPYANLCGLPLPTTETISASQYMDFRSRVLAYTVDNALDGQVVGILLGLGVPGYVDWAGQGDRIAVASLLHSDSGDDAVTLNPLHRDPPADRPTPDGMAGLRFTGRIDGKDLAEAVALVDRASVLMQSPPTADVGGTVWIDAVPEDPGVNPLFTQPMHDWAEGEGPGTLRLPLAFADGDTFTAIDSDLAFWGWGQPVPPVGFFEDPPGRRAVCVQLEAAEPPAVEQRNPAALHWLRRTIDAGYAAASASSRPYTLSTLPQPGVFFEALRRGWTLAEAWVVCQPFIRSGMQMLGDPLLTLKLPRAGYDVFGPAEGLEQIDTEAPAARLPATVMELPLTGDLAPADASRACYRVRRIDEQGRPDGGSATACLQFVEGRPVAPAPLPCWPDHSGWPLRVIDGHAEVVVLWPTPPVAGAVTGVVLEAELSGGAVQALWDGELDPGARALLVDADLPEAATRLRWRVHGPAGAHSATAWSAPPLESVFIESDLPLYKVSP